MKIESMLVQLIGVFLIVFGAYLVDYNGRRLIMIIRDYRRHRRMGR
jgi:hypothetical protein